MKYHRTITVSCLGFALFCSTACLAQLRNDPGSTDGQKACALPQQPTVEACWNCFQSLLVDCDKNNPEGDRRQACYEAANHFFTWCLGRVAQDRPDGRAITQSMELNNNKVWDIRSDFTYEVIVPAGTRPDDINIFLRTIVHNKPQQVRLEPDDYWVFNETGQNDLYVIVIDTSRINLFSNKVVGIVTAVGQDSDQEGGSRSAVEPRYGFAMAVPVVDPYDINKDGVFTVSDKTAAMELYSRHDIDYSLVTRILDAEVDRVSKASEQ